MSEGPVEVWLLRLTVPAVRLAALAELLDDHERERASQLAQPDSRRRYVAAHGAVREILGHRVGVPPARIGWRYGPKGKPEPAGPAAGLHVSLSHSGAFAALAISTGRRVGVDLQHFPAALDPARMAARYYRPDEAEFVTAGGPPGGRLHRFIRLWARKEACVKVTGGALMQGIRLPVRGEGAVLVHDPAAVLPGPYLVRDIAVPDGFGGLGAVAAEGAADYPVAQHSWPGERGLTAPVRLG